MNGGIRNFNIRGGEYPPRSLPKNLYIFENGVWGVAPSGVRAAAPHSAPARMPGVYAQRLCTMQSQPSIHSLSRGKGVFGKDAEIRTHQALHEAKPTECPKGDRD